MLLFYSVPDVDFAPSSHVGSGSVADDLGVDRCPPGAAARTALRRFSAIRLAMACADKLDSNDRVDCPIGHPADRDLAIAQMRYRW